VPEAEALQAKIDLIEGIRAQDMGSDTARSRQLIEHPTAHLKTSIPWPSNAALHKAWLHRLCGEQDEAVALARDIITLAEQHGQINAMLEAYKIAAIALQQAARFGEATQILEEAVTKARTWGRARHAELASIYFNLSRITVLRGEFDQAERFCWQTLEISEALDDTSLNIVAWLHQAEIQWFLGRREAARTLFDQAWQTINAHPEIDTIVEQSTAAWIATLLGEMELARQWMRSTGFNPRPGVSELATYLKTISWLLFHLQTLHILMADLSVSAQPLSCWESVQLWTEHALQISVERGETGWRIRALALLAVTHQERGQPDDALAALRTALQLAEPESLVYPFIACGTPMRGLLRKLVHRGDSPRFAAQALSAFEPLDRAASQPPPAAETPFEPLTAREREILSLVADGLSNTEIAQQLYLSIGTVKRHVANIFIKLGAESRTHALAIARKHGLI